MIHSALHVVRRRKLPSTFWEHALLECRIDTYSIFGSHILEEEELGKVQPICLIRFARTTMRLM